MFRGFLIASFLLLFYNQGFNQNFTSAGARGLSLQNATVALQDIWSYFTNPAAVNFSQGLQMGFCYENRFLLQELQNQSIVFQSNVKKGRVSFGYQTSGFSLYRYSSFGGGYALKLSEVLSFGINLNYQNIRIQDYTPENRLVSDIGVLVQLNSKIDFGCSIFNLGIKPDAQSGFAYPLLRSGIKYQLNEKLIYLVEFQKSTLNKLQFKTALEYTQGQNTRFRSGVDVVSKEFSFGVGTVLAKVWMFDFGTRWNTILGFSPHIGLIRDFTK
jgi:hypothetical protein